MSSTVRSPSFFSHRRFLEEKLSNLHKRTTLNEVKQIHARVIRSNLHRDPLIAAKLISSLSICHQITPVISIFNHVSEPNVMLYNTLIRAFTRNSLPSRAFATFFQMQQNGVVPDNFSYPFLLKACIGRFAFLRIIQMIHAHIITFNYSYDIYVPNSLIDVYAKCGFTGLESARKLFYAMSERDVITWNSMISGLIKACEMVEARRLFDIMPERDIISWNTALDGFAKAGQMDVAFELFQKAPEKNVISWTTMVAGYSKAGNMRMARLLFDMMPAKNLITWTVIIAGYAEKGHSKDASALFDQMEEAELKPDAAAIVSLLAACAQSGILELGVKIHAYVKGTKWRCNIEVCNTLIDMYAKCGLLSSALNVFNEMVEKDLVSWNSMLHGLAIHGNSEQALELFTKMTNLGVRPNAVTFIGVFSACAHAGLANEARCHFQTMHKNYGVTPEIEHYGCMVDVLGRAGHLGDAFELVKSMHIQPNAIIWGTLLGACRVHDHMDLAKIIMKHLTELQPSEAGNYALMSNIYASAGLWNNVAKVRVEMKGAGIQKPPGTSFIEFDNMVHEFTAGDRMHPHSYMIYETLNNLYQILQPIGCNLDGIT